MRISSVQKLKDQGANGSLAYQFATKVAKAFEDSFVNGSWAWTRYFCAAILENIKVGQAERVLRPFKDSMRNDALISVPIGAIEAMITHHSYEIKNVLHKVRTNPQAA